jgi:uncharacterized tellurite resistance protein B-like protein
MSISQRNLEPAQLTWVADILMGAAYADGTLEGSEAEAVHRVLRELFDGKDLPADILERVDQFNPKDFDLQTACESLNIETAEDRRMLLNLVSTITESNESHDLDESAYIRRVGACLGAGSSEYEDLTIEIISISGARRPPPPLPRKKV